MSDRETIKALNNRYARMDSEYRNWESHFRELRENIEPTLGRFDIDERTRKASSTINKKMIDTTARRGLRTLTSGLMAGMTSPSRNWFKIGVSDFDLADDRRAMDWAHTVQSRMYVVLRQSNAYRMLNTCYHNLGLYGTFGGLVVGDFEDVIRCHAFPMGSYRIAEGPRGTVDHMHRDIRMTVGQVVQRFGIERLPTSIQNAFRANRLHDPVVVMHGIEPRLQRDPMSPLSTNKPWASMYWLKERDDVLLEVSGFGAKPHLCPRWESEEGQAWSVSSPGQIALGDAVQLQHQHRDKAIAIKKSYDPPLQGNNATGAGAFNYRNVPGGITAVTSNDLRSGGLRPIYEVKPDITGLREDIYETQQRIEQAFFVDLFLMTAMSDRRQVTAREIVERHEEKLLVLGPVLEALDHDLLQPLINATYYYMEEAGIIPEPPDSIVNMPIKIEYISALAQAQKAVGVAPIERTLGFAATMEQMAPGTMDNIDADATLREFAEQVGSPPAMIRSKEQVEESRQAKAEAAQANMLMENAQPLASAASLISEASERGQQGIQQGAPL